jgi:bleomycin hydrolase
MERVSTLHNDINNQFLKECEENFYENEANVIARNAVVAIGSMIATTNSKRVNHIDHVFLNSIKKKNLKATNQGRSGRCWMFSGLNMFRHNVINALELENFEFSETYLFFWDKLERANRYLRWFRKHPNISPTDDAFKFMVDEYTSDGGWWNMFANLVNKYGLVPKSAMKETWQSDDSEDMNRILNDIVQSCANYIHKHPNIGNDEIRKTTMKRVYNTLVKFLGEPPKSFRWAYTNDEDVSNIIAELDPKQFMQMCIPDIQLDDFVVLTHIPGKLKERGLYEVKYTNNIYEGKNFRFLNLPMHELVKYTTKSVLSGIPVWFAADVCKDFNPYHSALDDQLTDKHTVFGENHAFSKEDKITFNNLQANHAMSIIGFNFGAKNKPESWQVENSWGYWDHETPGEDGFLYMSHSWFKQNVMQVVIHKNFLSRYVQKLLKQEVKYLNPWDCVAPALKVKPVDAPKIYDYIREKRRRI